MEYKYLSDGRKVAIVGQLNSTEWIVQEIFVTNNGDEIPSGERFTTKSLHDKRLESWANRQIKKDEEHLRRLKTEEGKIYDEIEKLKKIKSFYSDLSESISHIAKKYSNDSLETLFLFMEGRINYCVTTEWDIEIFKIKDFISYSDYGRTDGIKLLSIFGNTEGDMSWRINQYRDGSGSWREVRFFEKHEDAKKFAAIEVIKKAEKGHISYSEIKKHIDNGLPIDLTNEHIRNSLIKQISSLQTNVEKRKEECSRDVNKYLKEASEIEVIIGSAR